MTIVDAQKALLAESDKLTPDAQEALKFILEKLAEFDKPAEDSKTAKTAEKIEYPPEEIWRDVVGYGGIYRVSTYGRVISFHRGEGKILKHDIHKKGYHLVYLYKDGKPKCFGVHVLVAKAFIPNPENKPEVNHISGNKDDNSVWNLEWATSSENNKHALETGLRKQPRAFNAKFTDEQVREIRRDCIPGDKKFGFGPLARKFGVTEHTISNIYNRRSYKDVD